MADLLSQDEIDALLGGDGSSESSSQNELTAQEIDAIGEVANISMGTASTTLFTIVGHKVLITTPDVQVMDIEDVIKNTSESSVGIKTDYTSGLSGFNMLILNEDDVKVITDLMMGGDGTEKHEGPVTELQISAIGEAMNQMTGSAATSLASIINKKVDISPPKVFQTKFEKKDIQDILGVKKLVRIAFKMQIEGILDSKILQFIPVEVAKELVANLLSANHQEEETNAGGAEQMTHQEEHTDTDTYTSQDSHQMPQVQVADNPSQSQPVNNQKGPVNIQPIQFQAFDDGKASHHKENVNLLMDVPLQVTVELGRTQKLIKEILEFSPGSIIELDKLAGELVDILISGKVIAKGEVVIIDESFGVKVIDVVQPSKRI
jgi:flagellar motor switch protein FliN/FliY